jgi:hypothetical protein
MAAPPAAAGYSGTPLAKKLGITEASRVWVQHAPAHYRSLLPTLSPGFAFDAALTAHTDVVHLFAERRAVLQAELTQLRHAMRADAAVWVSWPKKASKRPTDITEDTIREVALPLGLVDVKVCAVDDVWSGLKLVIRKELR